ncbi:MAG: succinate dehydrogenase, hydrophobic membrane anchor protein [Alphaproteobacteria bacterium]|nr:succinate dehydrogenase, hydrophobic membrane anchor protein [Alphaproteobacteria bacterium]
MVFCLYAVRADGMCLLFGNDAWVLTMIDNHKKQKPQKPIGQASRHFIWQRVTGLANIPLVVFFIASLLIHRGADHATIIAYFGHPLIALIMLVFILSALWHMRLGMENVIDDYIHHKAFHKFAYLLNLIFTLFVAVVCILALVKLTLT